MANDAPGQFMSLMVHILNNKPNHEPNQNQYKLMYTIFFINTDSWNISEPKLNDIHNYSTWINSRHELTTSSIPELMWLCISWLFSTVTFWLSEGKVSSDWRTAIRHVYFLDTRYWLTNLCDLPSLHWSPWLPNLKREQWIWFVCLSIVSLVSLHFAPQGITGEFALHFLQWL